MEWNTCDRMMLLGCNKKLNVYIHITFFIKRDQIMHLGVVIIRVAYIFSQ